MATPDASPSAWIRAQRVGPLPDPVVVLLGGRIHPLDVPRLADQIREVLERAGSRGLICDVTAIVAPDAATVDAVCRIKVIARRLGCRLTLRNPSPELVELLGLVGLDEVVPVRGGLSPRVEAGDRTRGRSSRYRGRM